MKTGCRCSVWASPWSRTPPMEWSGSADGRSPFRAGASVVSVSSRGAKLPPGLPHAARVALQQREVQHHTQSLFQGPPQPRAMRSASSPCHLQLVARIIHRPRGFSHSTSRSSTEPPLFPTATTPRDIVGHTAVAHCSSAFQGATPVECRRSALLTHQP